MHTLASDGASQRVELLPEREILEDQFAMAAAGQRQRPDQHQNRVPIVLFLTRRINREGVRL